MKKYNEIIDLLHKHENYPFTNYNSNINEYILANFFWLNVLKNNYDMNEWEDYGGTYYNFDNSSSGGISILKICNTKKKRILMLSHMGSYEESFDDPFFLIGTGTIDDDLDNGITSEYYTLDIGVDLRHPKSLEVALQFLDKFLKENIPMDEMEALIDEFDEKYAHEFVRVAE